MTIPPLKIARSIVWENSPETTGIDPDVAGIYYSKLILEFWGFCVNGGTDLFEPGGFASGSIDMPTGFVSGSHIIVAGRDGVTEFGRDGEFLSNGVNFEDLQKESHISKMLLVTWKSGSTSPDDSIYRINGVVNSDTLKVDQFSGGGTTRLGNRPTFEDRSAINFRIIDLPQMSSLLGSMSGSMGMTLTFEGAPEVNTGQVRSQFRLSLSGSTPNDEYRSWELRASPSGSWLSGTFGTDASDVITTRHTEASITTTDHEMAITMLGGRDFLMFFVRSFTNDMHNGISGAGFHIEIPERLYAEVDDPNPICWMSWYDESLRSIVPDQTYYRGMYMVGADEVTRKWKVAARCALGDRVASQITPVSGGIWEGFDLTGSYSHESGSSGQIGYNRFDNTELSSDGILYLDDVAGQFSLARCRLKRVRYATKTRERTFRLGEEWFLINGSIVWPWDNAIVPLSLFEGVDR